MKQDFKNLFIAGIITGIGSIFIGELWKRYKSKNEGGQL